LLLLLLLQLLQLTRVLQVLPPAPLVLPIGNTGAGPAQLQILLMC
jgi:hypothetical protein